MATSWWESLTAAVAGLEGAPALAETQRAGLEALAAASPLYRQQLLRQPGWVPWLLQESTIHPFFGEGRLRRQLALVEEQTGDLGEALRLFRRQMSLRLAYRDVCGLAPLPELLRELSLLADVCVRRALSVLRAQHMRTLGEPLDAEGRAIPFVVLGAGKWGGQELNFCSDLDWILLFGGRGQCHKQGRALPTTAADFYTRLAQSLSQLLQTRTAAGFVYNIDVRLRPEGDAGALVWPLRAAVDYYFTRGQTWERLMLLRLRAIAGDLALGEEFLELVHTFRYPRHPPVNLPEEVAAMKRRTEREVVGSAALERDVKSGPGGIREVEFFTQVLQLSHAGRYPFLQTASTLEALEQLATYGLIEEEDRAELEAAYTFLRRVEHRLQMREEHQTHCLPEAPEALQALARSLGFDTGVNFLAALRAHRAIVATHYKELFPQPEDRAVEARAAWQRFFSGEAPTGLVQASLERWFGPAPDAAERLRQLYLGHRRHQLAREQLQLFQELAGHFDAVLEPLADALRTLERLERFAEAYGARLQLWKACSANPGLFRLLCLLFDRSTSTHELFCKHPDVMEELLVTVHARQKTLGEWEQELRLGPQGEGAAAWLWLYIRAEQTRLSIQELVLGEPLETVLEELCVLADAAARHTLALADPDGDLALVALGKWGGRELSIGSDLDLLVLVPDEPIDAAEVARRIQRWQALLGHAAPLGRTYELDLRLRPHGGDGPLGVHLGSLQRYHSEGQAQGWERQLLTRARPVGGSPELLQAFVTWRDALLYSEPVEQSLLSESRALRERALLEKAPAACPERAFKVARGGVMDLEHLAQHLQLLHGHRYPDLRTTRTPEVLHACVEHKLLAADDVATLCDNLAFLRQVEFSLRRDTGTGVSLLPEDAEALERLARWLGFSSSAAFWEEHRRRLGATHALVERTNLTGT